MPGFDGTGPLGQGPLTGGGRGFCAVPVGYAGNVPAGYAGIQGYPADPGYPYNVGYSGYNAPLYNNYPYYPGRGAYRAPIAAGSGYFGRGRGVGALFGRIGRGRGRGIRGMGRRF